MAQVDVTIPNPTFTITVPNSGIDVTTPTDQTIDVTVASPTVSVSTTQTTVSVLSDGILNITDTLNDTDDLPEGTNNLYYTNARVEAHEFSEVKIDNLVRINTASATTVSTAEFTLDSFSTLTYGSAHYRIQISSGGEYQFLDLALVQNGTAVNFVIYADIRTAGNLATYTTDIVSGSVRVRATPTNAVTTFTAVRTAHIA